MESGRAELTRPVERRGRPSENARFAIPEGAAPCELRGAEFARDHLVGDSNSKPALRHGGPSALKPKGAAPALGVVPDPPEVRWHRLDT